MFRFLSDEHAIKKSAMRNCSITAVSGVGCVRFFVGGHEIKVFEISGFEGRSLDEEERAEEPNPIDDNEKEIKGIELKDVTAGDFRALASAIYPSRHGIIAGHSSYSLLNSTPFSSQNDLFKSLRLAWKGVEEMEMIRFASMLVRESASAATSQSLAQP
ncbi:unnamed protein product [Caenorhabditis auriculariae]|uniref:Uncharacterized protein n=1 Tax=Caenorhabditis auriculariae TaxID=2777116 RepID=A0A8S1HR14_9PELO|nr:unnamed protein product [Caenorhabditis auriculariae]